MVNEQKFSKDKARGISKRKKQREKGHIDIMLMATVPMKALTFPVTSQRG